VAVRCERALRFYFEKRDAEQGGDRLDDGLRGRRGPNIQMLVGRQDRHDEHAGRQARPTRQARCQVLR
jgi:hypothetical protein